MKKLIQATLLALLCSLLTAFYLSKLQEIDVTSNEKTMPTLSTAKSVI